MEKVTQVNLEPFTVQGLLARTKNSDEADPKVAKIGSLWQSYFSFCPPDPTQPVKCYGVYTNFESDEYGAFDVIAGRLGTFPFKDSERVDIKAGSYLRFQKQGPLPEAVLELWQEVWHYFNTMNAPVRSYQTDFEEYLVEDVVAIYIGVEG